LFVERQKSVTAKRALITTVADEYRKIYNSKVESAVKIGEIVQSVREQPAGMARVSRHRLLASVVDNRKAARLERTVARPASEGR
jgi:hypothetical protein